MAHVGPRVLTVLLALGALALSGCPVFGPRIEISPGSVSFGARGTDTNFTIRNSGGASTWELVEVTRENGDAPWVAAEVPWLAAAKYSGDIGRNQLARVLLFADRAGLAAGNYENSGVRVTVGRFSQVVPVSLAVEATLVASPSRISLRTGARAARFTIQNTGTSDASWSIRYIEGGGSADTAQPLPADMVVSPNPGTTSAGGSTSVLVTWTQDRSSFRLLVDSISGNPVVTFAIGSGIEGLTVTPEQLTLYVNELVEGSSGPEPVSALDITNSGLITRNWTMTIADLTDSTATVPISLTPNQAATLPGETTEVAAQVTDRQNVRLGSGNYEVTIRASEEEFITLPVVIEAVLLPVVEASDPPAPDSPRPEVSKLRLLDFGRDEVQDEFWVANVGPKGSKLFFKATVYTGDGTEEGEGEGEGETGSEVEPDDPEKPLIISVSPDRGDTNGEDQDFFPDNVRNYLIDGVQVLVTIDRSAMDEDVEYRKIILEAYNEDFTAPIAAVEPVEIEIRVERPPLQVEGAINRSRPPYMMRFAFLLRDTLGNAIPTLTKAERDRINFTVSEDGILLDLNEVSMQVNGPEKLKANIVLMLDFTGSMYYAGTADAANPLQPGEAINQMKQAAARFLDDLPAGYRVALMYYNDRQQLNRLIYPFTTDRAALKNALNDFSLPVYLHGTSEVWDALADAVSRLAAEDPPETLPFDDADIRAVVFVTDGQDNSSTEDASSVQQLAYDSRVRLYPVSYAPNSPVNLADMITSAAETGGHLYNAGNVRNLGAILGNLKGLVLEPQASPGPSQLAFDVVNGGTTTLTWTLSQEKAGSWISSIAPLGATLAPGARTRVTVTADAALAGTPPLHTVTGLLKITSNNGDGAVAVTGRLNNTYTAFESLTADLTDEPGRLWSELRNQIVLSYITPKQTESQYNIRVEYTQPDNTVITGSFEEDGIFYLGDVRTGQLSLATSGIVEDPDAVTLEDAVSAEAYLRADYVPRGVNQFRVRFLMKLPEEIPAAAVAAFNTDAKLSVELAQDGLLIPRDVFASTWRLVSEGDNRYLLVTAQDNVLPYGAFGDLLRLRVTGLAAFVDACLAGGVEPQFLVEMRADNDIYKKPATPSEPSRTVYFLYPSGPKAFDRPLFVTTASDIAGAARSVFDLVFPEIDPEADNAWDLDEDGLPDYLDPFINDDTRPGLLTFPSLINLSGGSVTVTMTNNRMDSFTWLDPAATPPLQPSMVIPPASTSLLGRFSFDFTGSAGTLAPGASTTFKINFNFAGLASGTYDASLLVKTDTFGEERTPVTLTVN